MVVVRDDSGITGASKAVLTGFRHVILLAMLAGGTVAGEAEAREPQAQAADAQASLSQALKLAETGKCAEALPLLQRSLQSLKDKQLRYTTAFATVNCGMSVNSTAAVVDALVLLRSEFPDDPEVLYAFVRIFAQLADLTAQELAERFPNSAQVGKLNAQAFESKQMWKEAIEAYRQILVRDPKAPEVRFRIASILLDTSTSPESLAEAKKELETELEINPYNAAAVYVLGEIARRSGEWDEAIGLFSRASKLDIGFLEAYFALGMTLNMAGKHADAIAPLEQYTKGVPADAAGHYQLAVAYSRTGNKEAADRELQLQREALAKAGAPRPPTARVPQ